MGNKKGEIMILKLKGMTNEEKLKAMEALWDDICRSAPDFSSPAWHENILNQREQNVSTGEDRFVDWNKAKKDILDSIS